MKKTKTYFGESPRIITRIDNDCYEFLRYTVGFDNIDEFMNSIVKSHIESRGLNDKNTKDL
ncbi:MAG: hypothetical protein KAT05_15530 [Spirochaetes bacterium]|nr:hypothetical protein [Spirochaetota bacterium]